MATTFAERVRRRTRSRSDEGFTLIELAVALGIGSIVVSLVLVSMGTFFQLGSSTLTSGQANSNGAYDLQEIQRQVLSADVIFNPSTTTQAAKAGKEPSGSAVPKGFSLLIMTAAKGTTTCVQWRVLSTSTGLLETRSWPEATSTPPVTPWVVVTKGVINATVTPPVTPFSLATTTTYGSRLVNVTLVLKNTSRPGSKSSTSTTFKSSLVARDSEFFSPTDSQFCMTAPNT